MTYQNIALNRIRPNPFNPRKNFSGPKFEELKASIQKVGIIEPVLVRPINGITCAACPERKGMANKKPGVKIPGEHGKCIRPAGLRVFFPADPAALAYFEFIGGCGLFAPMKIGADFDDFAIKNGVAFIR